MCKPNDKHEFVPHEQVLPLIIVVNCLILITSTQKEVVLCHCYPY